MYSQTMEVKAAEPTDEHRLMWLYSQMRNLQWRLQHWKAKTVISCRMRVLDIVKYDLNDLQINSSLFIQYVNTLFFSYTLWDNSSQHNSTWFKELSFIVKPE